MPTDPLLSKEFAIIFGGEVIAWATDFQYEVNKVVVDITKLGDDWKAILVDTKDWTITFNGMVTRGATVVALLWNPLTAYVAGDYVVLGGLAYEAQGATTGDNPSTDDGTNWLETSVYSGAVTYDLDDLVYVTSVANENRVYISLQNVNLGNDPLTSPLWWERISTDYESLLNDIKFNDDAVVITMKPSGALTKYAYGPAKLTALTASIATGDKMVFSGSMDGDGALSTATTPA